MPGIHPHGSTGTNTDQAELERLATKMTALGYKAMLVDPVGRLPYLEVSNPQTNLLTEKVYSQAGIFFWPWAQSIGSCDQVATVAAIVARVLRTADGDQ